jgi:hypothetical protein
VDGAQADTLKKSIRTSRRSDPLAPVYHDLDGDLLGPGHVPLVPAFLMKNATLGNTIML